MPVDTTTIQKDRSVFYVGYNRTDAPGETTYPFKG